MKEVYKVLPLLDELQRPISHRPKRLRILVLSVWGDLYSYFSLPKIGTCLSRIHILLRLRFYATLDFSGQPYILSKNLNTNLITF